MVHESTARYKVVVCGRRWGKTLCAVNELIKEALKNENRLYWLCSPTYRQSKMIAWRMLKDQMPIEIPIKYNESELSATLPNGCIIELRGADNPDSLRGVAISGIVIDEFATIPDNWRLFQEVIRPALADKQGWVLFISTPKGKDSLYELYLRGERKEEGWESFHYTTYDNPYIPKKEIDEAKETTPSKYFNQEFLASFLDYVGLIYPEFNAKDHVINPTYLPAIYPRIGAIDPAISGTTAVLKAAISETGEIIFYDEYYEKDKRVSEVVENIKEEDVRWLIDPASAARNTTKDGKLYSLFDEYQEQGVYAYPAENDVNAGINRFGELLKQKKIKIFSSCVNFIHELERYHWTDPKETLLGQVDPKPFKALDHLVDCGRYIIMSRPSDADIHDPTNVNPNSPLGRMMLGKVTEGFKYERV